MFLEDYVLLAFFVAVCGALATVIQKHAVEEHVTHNETLLVVSGVVAGSYGGFVYLTREIRHTFSLSTWVLLIVSGITAFTPLYLYYRALRLEDASAIAPMHPFQHVFTIILAFVFLGEQLTNLEYIGVFLILGGVFIVAIVREPEASFPSLSPAFLIMASTLFLWSVSGIVTKYLISTVGIDYWTVFVWNRSVSLLIGLTMLLHDGARMEMQELISTSPSRRDIFVIASAGVGMFGTLVAFVAYETGPISIIGPITSTSSLLTVFMVAVLTRIGINVDSEDSTRNFSKNSMAATLAIAGIVLIS